MTEARLRSWVAQGWTTMFAVFVANLLMDVIRSSVEGSTRQWMDHMGPQGIQVVLVVMAIYAAMPLLVRTFSAVPFRVVVVMLTLFMGLFVAAHEVSHLVQNHDKPFGVLHALDLMHHALVVGTMVAGIAWTRAGIKARASANQPESSQQEMKKTALAS
jgi:hypothetical protein